eukprot:1177899-Prorocentrum_minimum.AAC.1
MCTLVDPGSGSSCSSSLLLDTEYKSSVSSPSELHCRRLPMAAVPASAFASGSAPPSPLPDREEPWASGGSTCAPSGPKGSSSACWHNLFRKVQGFGTKGGGLLLLSTRGGMGCKQTM